MSLRPSDCESQSNSGGDHTEFFFFSTWQKLLETPSEVRNAGAAWLLAVDEFARSLCEVGKPQVSLGLEYLHISHDGQKREREMCDV